MTDHNSDSDPVYGDMHNATNTDPNTTDSVDETPPDTSSGGAPQPVEDEAGENND